MKILKIFYNEKQTAKGSQGFSPSAGKPAQAVESWVQKWGDKLEVVESGKVTVMDYALAHEKVFVEDVLRRKAHNGFGNTSKEVADSLPYTTGSYLDAARSAIAEKSVTISPTSGMHHAGYNFSGGFCTFNGLMVTALKLKEEGLVKKVGIVDVDFHAGNGTKDIIEKTNSGDWVNHYSLGYCNHKNAQEFLNKKLPEALESMKDCDIILCQLGADASINDPLGGLLNDEEMRKRDHIIFDFCVKNSVPLVWNVAGGYKKDENGTIAPVLKLHDISMEECLISYGLIKRRK